MNAETLLKILRHCMSAETGCVDCPNYDLVTGTCAEETEILTINVIESLSEQLDAAIAGQETLQKAFAESQRREQVLWENLEDAVSKNAGCVLCVHEFGWRPPEEGEPHETV